MKSEPIRVVANLIEYVTVEKFCELSGYSSSAVAKKTCPGGIWAENKVWRWGEDGRKLMSIAGFNRWAKTCPSKPSTRGRPNARNVNESHGTPAVF